MTNNSNSLRSIVAKALDVCLFTGPSQRVLSRIRHSPAQLIVVTGGAYTATVDTKGGRQQIRAAAGDVVFWPAGVDHTDGSEEGKPLHCITVWLNWCNPPPDLPFVVRDTEHVIDLLANRLLTLAHEPARRTVLGAEADAYLSAIVAEFICRAQTAGDALLARVTYYTEEHIHGPIRLEDLARHVGLEKHHFGRKYRQLTGRTPIQDVKRRKAAYAKHVLQLSPGRTLSSVGALVGIRDVATLSRSLEREHINALFDS